MLVQLIRHARTAGNEQKKYIGVTDEPLSPNGRKELEAIVRQGVYSSAELVFTSPLRRCLETASLIFKETPYTPVPELAECNFGEFEGKNYEELQANAFYRNWVASGGLSDIPGGERAEHFKKRCSAGFQLVIRELFRQKSHSAAIVLHGGSIMAVMERFSPDNSDFYDWQVPNCGGMRLIVGESSGRDEFVISQAEKILLPDSSRLNAKKWENTIDV